MDMKQQHLFEQIPPKYEYTSNYCWQPKCCQIPRYLRVFGLPTSNTEHCQIQPNTIWELAFRKLHSVIRHLGKNLSVNWYLYHSFLVYYSVKLDCIQTEVAVSASTKVSVQQIVWMSQPYRQSLSEMPTRLGPSSAPSNIWVSSLALNSSASPTETVPDGSSFHLFIRITRYQRFSLATSFSLLPRLFAAKENLWDQGTSKQYLYSTCH